MFSDPVVVKHQYVTYYMLEEKLWNPEKASAWYSGSMTRDIGRMGDIGNYDRIKVHTRVCGRGEEDIIIH